MKRVGIIIGVPDSPQGGLPGAEVDLEHCRRFLGFLERHLLSNAKHSHARCPKRKVSVKAN